jgi:hypothetical protein
VGLSSREAPHRDLGQRLSRTSGSGSSPLALGALIVIGLAGCGGAPTPGGTLFLETVARRGPLPCPGSSLAVAVVNVGKGSARRTCVDHLSASDAGFNLEETGGRLVFFGDDGTYAVDSALRSPARELGSSDYYVPSAIEGGSGSPPSSRAR